MAQLVLPGRQASKDPKVPKDRRVSQDLEDSPDLQETVELQDHLEALVRWVHPGQLDLLVCQKLLSDNRFGPLPWNRIQLSSVV